MSDSVPLTGEPPALDLVNTRARGADGPVDHLGDLAGMRSWLALQADRLPEAQAAARATLDEQDLAAVHAVREHIAAAVRAGMEGKELSAGDIDGLNRALAAAPAVRRLARDGTAVTAAFLRTGSIGAQLAARFAEDAADLLGEASRIRQCENEDCVMVFLPAHPRRRWCAPDRCGNRARVARYYQRHKT
ncbi:CGNR zinc finger domain-containing protein [Streptomyces sp. NPDC003023]|uniref:CGNR zinc finger domain-containing protein n=1 Tax=Streptomyces sp. NPDC003023 TaxID=3364675 RepID=UPI003698CD15